jgi:hypothetical protein
MSIMGWFSEAMQLQIVGSAEAPFGVYELAWRVLAALGKCLDNTMGF